MKKLLLFTLTLALVLLALASCGASANCEHAYSGPCDPSCNKCANGARTPEAEHTFTDCVDTTCDVCETTRTPLEHTYTGNCDTECNACGATRTAENHTYSADCDSDCDVCGETRDVQHVYTNTCDKTCNVCGAVRLPDDHVYSNACDTTCDICGELRIASNHVYSSVCDADCNICSEPRIAESHTYDHACDADCNVCGAVRTVFEHTYDDACDAICNYCGTPRENVHDFSDWVVTSEATCETAAIESKFCGLCGETETRTVGEALGHVFDNECDIACNRTKCDFTREITHTYTAEYGVKLPATCTAAEVLNRFCDVCGAEETKIGEAALGHTFENNCDADCDRENCDFVRVIDEHDHLYSDWETLSPATCEEAEIQQRSCSVCGGTETREGEPKLNHLFDHDCDTDCNRQDCDYERTTEHDYQEWVTLDPATCLTPEIEQQVCFVCGAFNPETREGDPALGHIYTDACDAICDRENCGFERTPPHDYTDEHDVTCNGCDYVRPCNGHKALENDCLTCEYCGNPIPGSEHTYSNLCDTSCNVCGFERVAGSHQPSQENCTICLYCNETIAGAEHVSLESDCTKCQNCDAGTGKGHTPHPDNCLICENCPKESGAAHTPSAEDCTKCDHCGKSIGTAHTDANGDKKCDNCEQESLPGENWFPWAPL